MHHLVLLLQAFIRFKNIKVIFWPISLVMSNHWNPGWKAQHQLLPGPKKQHWRHIPHPNSTNGYGVPHLPPPPPPPQPRMVDMFNPPSKDNHFQHGSRWGTEVSAHQQQHQQEHQRSTKVVGKWNTFQDRMYKSNPYAPIASQSVNSLVPMLPPPPPSNTGSMSNLKRSSGEEPHTAAAPLQNSDQVAMDMFANARVKPFLESSNHNTCSGRWHSMSRAENSQQPQKHYVRSNSAPETMGRQTKVDHSSMLHIPPSSSEPQDTIQNSKGQHPEVPPDHNCNTNHHSTANSLSLSTANRSDLHTTKAVCTDSASLEAIDFPAHNDAAKASTTTLDSRSTDTASSSTEPQDNRTIRLQQAKEKLRHAQNQLVKALKKRKHTQTPVSQLPPITALSQPLMIINVFDKDDDLVRLLPDPVLLEGRCDVIIPADSDMEEDQEVIPSELHQKGKALRKNLLLLKKKKLELTLRMQQQQQQQQIGTSFTATEDVKPTTEERKDPLLFTVEALKRRQEKLQQTVDSAYWKRLATQQRNLLTAEQNEVRQHEENLKVCQAQIEAKQDAIMQCEKSIRESIAREKCLNEMIETTIDEVLSARKRRRVLQLTRQPNETEGKNIGEI